MAFSIYIIKPLQGECFMPNQSYDKLAKSYLKKCKLLTDEEVDNLNFTEKQSQSDFCIVAKSETTNSTVIIHFVDCAVSKIIIKGEYNKIFDCHKIQESLITKTKAFLNKNCSSDILNNPKMELTEERFIITGKGYLYCKDATITAVFSRNMALLNLEIINNKDKESFARFSFQSERLEDSMFEECRKVLIENGLEFLSQYPMAIEKDKEYFYVFLKPPFGEAVFFSKFNKDGDLQKVKIATPMGKLEI